MQLAFNLIIGSFFFEVDYYIDNETTDIATYIVE